MFSAIAEELGSIFGICLILVCMSCFIMFVNIAMQLTNRFYRLVSVGLGATYATQVFLTIGGGIKLIPMTGGDASSGKLWRKLRPQYADYVFHCPGTLYAAKR